MKGQAQKPQLGVETKDSPSSPLAPLPRDKRSYTLDSSERLQAEETLRASEERFRALADNAQDGIARFDHDGRYLYVNPFITRALGLPAEAIVGKTAEALGRNAGVEKWETRLREVFA